MVARFLIVPLVFFSSLAYGQDTLHFIKNKNQKTFDLPLNEFPVQIKPRDGKKEFVLIRAVQDSVLFIGAPPTDRDQMSDIHEEISKLYLRPDLDQDDIDSIAQELLYPLENSILISEIDKIIVPNRNSGNMKTILNITQWTAIAWLIASPFVIAGTQSVGVFIALDILAVAISIVAIIIENKTIDLDKWSVVFQ